MNRVFLKNYVFALYISLIVYIMYTIPCDTPSDVDSIGTVVSTTGTYNPF